jgi:hypothetical protein
VARNLLSRDRRAVDPDDTTVERSSEATDATGARVEEPDRRMLRARQPTRTDEPVVTEPAQEAPPRWARTSTFATLGLIIGLAALFATLTGLLAAVGVALGVLGGAIAAGGLVGASRRGVTGHGVALFGLACSLVAVVLGVLAISGNLSWLDSKTDEVARARDWLNAHIAWFKHW